MANLTSRAPSKTHRVLVFGAPKSGKTQLAGELASHYKILWFDLENGFETLLKLPKESQSNIELITLPDTKVYPIAIETMLKVITGNKVEICEAHGKVSCQVCKKLPDSQYSIVELNSLNDEWVVVVDSLTQLSNSAMNHLTKNCDELYKPEWSDYRNQGQLLDKFLSQIQQAKFNVVCITHECETEMEDGKKKLVPVAGTTNFSRNTAKYFDHVVYSELKNKSHKFASSTTYANNVLTGSRSDVTLESSQNPSLKQIFTEHSTTSKPQTNGQIAVDSLKGMVKS